jgi:hypothetical protein
VTTGPGIDILDVLRDADPDDKPDIYTQLGLRLTYQPGDQIVQADVSPAQHWLSKVSEGGLEPPCPFGALAPQASASAYSATRTWSPEHTRGG